MFCGDFAFEIKFEGFDLFHLRVFQTTRKTFAKGGKSFVECLE